LGFVLAVGASNRLPEDEALNALFDRFLLRVRSENVPAEMLSCVLEAGWKLQVSASQSPNGSLSVNALRALQECIPLVEVEPIRNTYVNLVHRLRNAGIAISDRRAVRLQRLAAASALLCQRDFVHRSDLWVLRYVWDTLEQIEVLNGIVNETVHSDDSSQPGAESESQLQVHPRFVSVDEPNPELIASELDQVDSQVESSLGNKSQRNWLRDRLGLMLSRVEWIRKNEPREFLKQRVHALLERLEVEN
jgi:MoxR-like ATPase